MLDSNEKLYTELRGNPKGYCLLDETLRASYPVMAIIFSKSENRNDPELIASIPIEKLQFRIFVLTSNWEDLEHILVSNEKTNLPYEDVKKTIAYNLFALGKKQKQIESYVLALLLTIMIGVILIQPANVIAAFILTAVIVLVGLLLFIGEHLYAKENLPFLKACLNEYTFFIPRDNKVDMSNFSALDTEQRDDKPSTGYLTYTIHQN